MPESPADPARHAHSVKRSASAAISSTAGRQQGKRHEVKQNGSGIDEFMVRSTIIGSAEFEKKSGAFNRPSTVTKAMLISANKIDARTRINWMRGRDV